MTVFSGYREHMEPLSLRLEQTGALVRMPRRRRLRRAWSLYGPLLAIVFALSLIVGSWAALVVREFEGLRWH